MTNSTNSPKPFHPMSGHAPAPSPAATVTVSPTVSRDIGKQTGILKRSEAADSAATAKSAGINLPKPG